MTSGGSDSTHSMDANKQALALKEEGNELFRARRVQEAAAKYEEALQCALATADHLPVVLLQNVAAAALQLSQHQTAFFHAGDAL